MKAPHPLTIRLGPSRQRLHKIAKEANISVSALVRIAVDRYLEDLSKSKGQILLSEKTTRALEE